jgi:anti-sigma-K factor RskA
MRRSLVLTDEAARHPFRASLPPHVRTEDASAHDESIWRVTASDAYFACLAATLAFIF